MAFLFRGRPLACAGGLPRQLFAQGARLARQAPARPRRFELSTLPQLAWRHAPAAGPALLGDVPAWRGRRRSPAGRRALSTAPDDPYKLLGVTRGLNDHEYKVAYLKRARECHPDLHPNDPRGAPAQATARFQSLSAAFELIKDSGKRAAFNARPRYSQAHHTSYQQQADPAGDAAATWVRVRRRTTDGGRRFQEPCLDTEFLRRATSTFPIMIPPCVGGGVRRRVCHVGSGAGVVEGRVRLD
ncbi:hypothetical protein M885DRAFT_447310 [Pelagophyceae sp. CCMP2097]|nr:hypothetical protein M885DRAFT_447310 [Pelagophyceae sp. CCMP2097]